MSSSIRGDKTLNFYLVIPECFVSLKLCDKNPETTGISNGFTVKLIKALIRFVLEFEIDKIIVKTRYSAVFADMAVSRSSKIDWNQPDGPVGIARIIDLQMCLLCHLYVLAVENILVPRYGLVKE